MLFQNLFAGDTKNFWHGQNLSEFVVLSFYLLLYALSVWSTASWNDNMRVYKPFAIIHSVDSTEQRSVF